MKRLGSVLAAVATLLAASAVARAQPAPAAGPPAPEPAAAPGMRIVTGQAPVVGGNAAGARERALDDAIRQAVEQTLAELADPATRAAQAKTIKALLARARSFVLRYRALEEGETNGVYILRLEAEVDEAALRRKLEAPVATPSSGSRPAVVGVVVVPGDARPETSALITGLASALAAAGIKAKVADAAGAAPGQAVARVTGAATDEGAVRGTGQLSIACQGAAQLVAGPAAPAGEITATARAFAAAGPGGHADAGRADCLTHLAADLSARIAGKLGAGAGFTGGGAAGDLRALTLDADVVEPGAVSALLKGVRSVGAVSSAELTRVAGGRVEIRLSARGATGAIVAALSRGAGSMITLSDVEVAGDVIRARARLRPRTPSPTSNP